MSGESVVAIIGGVIALLGVIAVVAIKIPKRLKSPTYTRKWRELQKLCVNKETWPEALVGADSLLDSAMKKKKITGKTMGERLVSAGDKFSNKDALWTAHKLANHVEHAEDPKLRESDVKDALVAFRQALRDLGAL